MFNDELMVSGMRFFTKNSVLCFVRFEFAVLRLNGLANRGFRRRKDWIMGFSSIDGWNSGIERETAGFLRKRCPLYLSHARTDLIVCF